LWFVGAVVLAFGELITPATFFFLPFAIGALCATMLAVLGFGLGWEWLGFIAVSCCSFAGLWPLGRRLEKADEQQEGVGATRWVGQEARVVEDIAANGIGTVRLEREEWRAESLTGARIRAGSTVVITRIAGTRLVVVPVDEPLEDFSNPELERGGPGDGPNQGAM
jgi:membrane protein implicated in regulation of membrane protease activity